MKLDGRSITASEYYYGCPPDTWDSMLYPDAILDRYEKVKEIYYALTTLSLDLKYRMSEDEHLRYFKISKAFNDTKQLIDERTLII